MNPSRDFLSLFCPKSVSRCEIVPSERPKRERRQGEVKLTSGVEALEELASLLGTHRETVVTLSGPRVLERLYPFNVPGFFRAMLLSCGTRTALPNHFFGFNIKQRHLF
jgi:hypothetical protein